MKILTILSNPDLGGTETLLIETIPYIEALGCEIEIVNTCDGSTMKGFSAANGIKYSELSGKGRLFTPRDIIDIVRFIRAGDYDVLHVFGLRISILLRLLKPFLQQKPLVIGLHGINLWHKWYHTLPDALTQRLCDAFVPISNAVKQRHVLHGRLEAKKMVVIPNGTDLTQFAQQQNVATSRRDLGIPEEKTIITTIANIRHAKGHDFYLDVIRTHFADRPDVHFVWIGRGSLEAEVKAKIAEYGLQPQITMLGRVESVKTILAQSDVFVLSSREEGMPRALMEAMAMSLPCVATRVGGIGEVIVPDESGLLSEFGDVDTFAAHIDKLVVDKDFATHMGDAARKRIEDAFDIRKIAKHYFALYGLLAANNRDIESIRKTIEKI